MSTELKIAHYVVAAVLLIDSGYIFRVVITADPSGFTIHPALGYLVLAGIGIGFAWAAGVLVRRATR